MVEDSGCVTHFVLSSIWSGIVCFLKYRIVYFFIVLWRVELVIYINVVLLLLKMMMMMIILQIVRPLPLQPLTIISDLIKYIGFCKNICPPPSSHNRLNVLYTYHG